MWKYTSFLFFPSTAAASAVITGEIWPGSQGLSCDDALVCWYNLLSSVYTSSLAATTQLGDDYW